jgi:hypothetical protein
MYSPAVSHRKSAPARRVREHDGSRGHVDADGERLRGEQELEEALLEEDFDDFLDDGEQPAVVDADAPFQEREQRRHLRQRLVVVAQRLERRRVDLFDDVRLVRRVERRLVLERDGVALALRLGEGEDDGGLPLLLADDADDPLQVRLGLAAAGPPAPLSSVVGVGRGRAAAQAGHRRFEVGLAERAGLVDDEVQALAAARKHVVHERRGPVVGVDDVARLPVRLADPRRELARVRDRRAQEHEADRVRQQDDRLLPDDAALAVAHVVDLVVDDLR